MYWQMTLNASYQCIDGCNGSYSLDQVIYRCPQCGELLTVVHDLAALRERTAQEWRSLFAARAMDPVGIESSGVWSKREWVNPNLATSDLVSLPEGFSPLFRAQRLGKHLGLQHLSVKLCGNSATGSFKDLGMTVLVSQVNRIKRTRGSIRAAICASTGDTSASLAAYCAAAGIPAIVLLPADKISTAQLIQPLASGALTLTLDADFDGCMRLVNRLAASPEYYLANSLNSLRLEGQKTIAIEVVQQLGWQSPDWVIVPGGNLGNISAIGQGFLLMKELGLIEQLPRLACIQAQNANPLYKSFKTGFQVFRPQPAKATAASAIRIGNPVSIKRAIRTLRETNGLVEQASESELAEAAALGDRFGLFTCPQTGVAFAGLIKLIAAGQINRDDRVIVISTASGLKFVDFKIHYHNGTLPELSSRSANRSRPLPLVEEQVRGEIESFISHYGI